MYTVSLGSSSHIHLCTTLYLLRRCPLHVGRSSKAIEELQVPGMGRPNPAETRSGDTAILNVVEAYCYTARLKTIIRKTFAILVYHMHVESYMCMYNILVYCLISSISHSKLHNYTEHPLFACGYSHSIHVHCKAKVQCSCMYTRNFRFCLHSC